MSKYFLQIMNNGVTEKIALTNNQAYSLTADIPFQIIDEQGIVQDFISKQHNNDLWIYINGNDEQPELILQNYSAVAPAYALNSTAGSTANSWWGKVAGVAASLIAAKSIGTSNKDQDSVAQSVNTTSSPINSTVDSESIQTAKGTSVKAEPLPVGELPPLETAKGTSVKAEPLPKGELPPLETAKGTSVKAEPLSVGELPPLETAKGTSVKAEPLPVGELPPLETAKGTSVKAEPLPVGELPPLETAKGTSVKAEPLPVGELPSLVTAKGDSVKAEPLPKGELPPLETAKGTSVKAEPLPVGELPPLETAKGTSVKAEPLPVGELPPLETAKGTSVKAEPLPVGELPPLETAKGTSVKAEPLPVGELPPLETAKGTSVKAEPLPVGELPPLETAKGTSVKAEPLPVGELPPLETAKGTSVKAEPLPVGELPPLETAKGTSVKAEPLPVGELPPLETAKGTSVKAEPLPVGELPPLETAKGTSVKAEPLPVGELPPLETAKGTSVKAEPLPVGELPPLETAKGTSVKAEPLPKGELPHVITIESIDDDNTITPDELKPQPNSQTYTLTGKVNLTDTIFTKYKNRELIDKVIVKIDGKEYQADYNKTNDTFKLTLNPAEAVAVNGKTISEFSLTVNSNIIPNVLDDVKKTGLVWGDGTPLKEDYYIWVSNFDNDIKKTLTQEMFSLDNNNAVQLKNGVYTIKTADLAERTTKISGSLNGEKIANQSVDIEINDKHYTAKTDNAGKFTLDVATHELAQDKDQKLIAKWQVDGKTVTDTASFVVAKNQANAGVFVSHHNALNVEDMPYFMQALHQGWNQQHWDKIGKHEPLHITYHFNTAEETLALLDSSKKGKTYDWASSQDNIDVTNKVLNTISNYANIKFDYTESSDATIGFAIYHFDNAGAAGYALQGGKHLFLHSQYFHFNEDTKEFTTFKKSNAYHTMTHELLHMLGWKHTHEGQYQLNKTEDNRNHTFISYNHYNEITLKDIIEDARILDLVYLHYLYGVNPNQRTGNDVYTFKPFNNNSVDKDIYIWDGAGIDTFDASSEKQGVTVNLTPGSWIHSGAKTQNLLVENMIAQRDMTNEELVQFFDVKDGSTFAGYRPSVQGETVYTKGQAFIGYDTQLENLIGSNYDDNLTGNNAPNLIVGLNGNDNIDGGKGNDDLHGSSGNDTLIGGDGDDRLNGGAGNDVLTGNSGSDVFVFSNLLDGSIDVIQDFDAGKDKIELSANIFNRLSAGMAQFDDYVQFDKASGKLSYDADGDGAGKAVQFATLQNYTGELEQNHFIIA